MAACGAVSIGGAFSLWRRRRPGWMEVGVYMVAGLLTVVLMSGANFALGSDFRWLLIAPVMLWLVALIRVGRALGRAARP
jgi:hypothetical protein